MANEEMQMNGNQWGVGLGLGVPSIRVDLFQMKNNSTMFYKLNNYQSCLDF